MKKIKNIQKNKGAAMMILVFFFMLIGLTILIGIIGPTVREFRVASVNLQSKKAYSIAESGAEDMMYRIKNNMDVGTIGGERNLFLKDFLFSIPTEYVDLVDGKKKIVVKGDMNSNQRTIDLTLTTSTGVSFSYGVLAGKGGFTMDNNSKIIGNIYSNGTIIGSGEITGSAMSANAAALVSDQNNGSGIPPYNITFGNHNTTQDFAQSFQVSTTETVNKVELYLRKVSTPSNLTVRIVNNSGNSPGTTTIASGSLSVSLVSNNYGWVSVPFSTNPELTAGTTYWLVIDGGSNSSRYYQIGANDNGYINGTAKIGRFGSSWNETSPASLDGYFNLYLGGVFGLIDGITIGDSAYANTVKNSNIGGTNYCQIGLNNNKNCDTSKEDPTQIAMPISEQNIIDWKNAAETGGTHSGNLTIYDTTMILGPKKITGNLIIDNNAILTMNGHLWIEGTLTVSNNALVKLMSSYGSSDGVIVVDGIIDINNNSSFQGSGTEGSYILVLSTSDSDSAISLGNNGGAVILYAHNGTVTLSNNAEAKSLNGYKIHLSNNVIVTYDSGIMNSNFTSGPSGSWKIDSWKEIE